MIEITALAFLLMGVVALVSPHSITRWVAITTLPVPARNEVRAVYGGYGVAMAVLLVVCRDQPQWRDGVVVTLSMALLAWRLAGCCPGWWIAAWIVTPPCSW